MNRNCDTCIHRSICQIESEVSGVCSDQIYRPESPIAADFVKVVQAALAAACKLWTPEEKEPE